MNVTNGNPTGNPCLARSVLDTLGNKWSVLVIRRLADLNPQRFSELRRNLDGISQRMLTETLRNLERDGLLTRTVYAAIPPKVEYALTELGSSFATQVNGMISWAAENGAKIAVARSLFDDP